MASTEIAPIIAKEFVALEIDQDRTPGGKDLLGTYQRNGGGIPWFVFLDGAGKPLVTSDGPKGNIGFPAQPHEIEHFKAMLVKVKRHLSDADIAYLVKSLQEAAKKTT